MCPSCPEVHPLQDLEKEAPLSPFHDELAKKHVEMNRTDEAVYPNCQAVDCTGIALRACRQCGPFCDQHMAGHNGLFANHSLLLFDSEPGTKQRHIRNNCSKHNLLIEYFCPACPSRALKCAKCVIEDHQGQNGGHENLSIVSNENAFKLLITNVALDVESRKKLADQQIERLDRMQEEFSRSCTSVEANYEKLIKDLQSIIQMIESNYSLQLRQLLEEIVAQLQENHAELVFSSQRFQFISDSVREYKSQPIAEWSLCELATILSEYQTAINPKQQSLRIQPCEVTFKISDELRRAMSQLSTKLIIEASPLTPASATDSEIVESFHSIISLASDVETGNFVGIDPDSRKIIVLDPSFKVLASHRVNICLQGIIHAPLNVACSSKGVISVVDSLENAVHLFERKGSLLLTIRKTDKADLTEFFHPQSAAFDRAGNLYVADSGNHRIVSFDASGRYKASINLKVLPLNLVGVPVSVCTNDAEQILVLCGGHSEVLIFNSALEFVKIVPIIPAKTMLRAHIIHIARNCFCVWDNSQSSGVLYTYQGDFLGTFQVKEASACCVSRDGDLVFAVKNTMVKHQLGRHLGILEAFPAE
eukprot:TRINITY_DN7810_c0_g1_i1.p1 TRINITY_DN7810_c0_g1~~TRINITY_DN7810_c0_g1_i1.p1  ORF type:complete len:592 (+),score=101.03 TRINITY_DN7810_c0_g1_i1:335-2110(+)